MTSKCSSCVYRVPCKVDENREMWCVYIRGPVTSSDAIKDDKPCPVCKGKPQIWKHGESKHHSCGAPKKCDTCNGIGRVPK